MDLYVVVKLRYHISSFVKKNTYKILFGNRIKFGKNVTFRRNVSFAPMNGSTIVVGDNVFFNHNCSVYAMDYIEIGAGTIFGENVKIYDHNHLYKDINMPIKEQGYSHSPIKIGKHCWIASNVMILKGVTIGDNVTIGAGCVLYKSVPSNTVVVSKQELLFK